MMSHRFATLFLVLGSLGGALGQTCNSICNQFCPSGDQEGGKAGHLACLDSCLGRCAKCSSSAPVGTLFPKYYVLGLIYAPPGCTSTAAQKCSSQSSVDYQDGSTMGTKVSTENSFASSVDLKVNLGFAVKDVGQFGASASAGYTSTTTDSNSQTITKGQTLDVKATGNGDGVNHDQDVFILLLNPALAVRQAQQFTGGFCSASKNVEYYMGLNSSSGTQVRFTLSVAELKNPSIMPPDVAQQLKTLNFTTADFQTILSLDPFANGPTTIDPNRFTPTTISFPYEPPVASTECNGGVCSCLAMSDSIKNDFATEGVTSVKTEYKVGFSEQVSGINSGIFSFGASSDQSFTWTSSSSTTNTTVDSQSATATVQCPSITYNGPTIMSVYWDLLYGSFMFVPTGLNAPTVVLSRGTVTGTSGLPMRHEPVSLSFAGKTYRTYTDSLGKYIFASRSASTHTGTGELSVKGVHQGVAIGSTQEIAIRVPLSQGL